MCSEWTGLRSVLPSVPRPLGPTSTNIGCGGGEDGAIVQCTAMQRVHDDLSLSPAAPEWPKASVKLIVN